ncbi:membrane protein insertion efficiency factor YidD [Streptomyces sp. NPDC000594]|uniref:membrane protein insertion efficiency factor YidD n=1 Tax=Streptomyces sp. NPDC000594 TaxID=3154261 RepID=UPI0033341E77
MDTYVAYCGPCPLKMIYALTAAVRLSASHGPAPVDAAAPRPTGRVAGTLYGAVHHYRTRISPTKPPCCPYTPSCSTYAIKALHQHGAVRGVRLIAGRLLRCRPGAARRRGGRDPVPR